MYITDHQEIQVEGPTMDLNGKVIYFPFPDRAWGYDCERCGSFCCKGNGFGASPDEFAQLETQYPGLKLFARAGDRPTIRLLNLRGNCFFLEPNGFCRIQQEHGRAAKPFVCKMFPFNLFELSGDVLIVRPKPNLCPLHLCSDETTGVVVRHEDLVAELSALWSTVMATAGHQNERTKRRKENGNQLKSRRWTRELVEFEEWLRDFDGSSANDNLALWSAQAVASRGFPKRNPPDPVDCATVKKDLLSLVNNLSPLFGFTRLERHNLFRNENLRSLTSMVRLDLLRILHFLPFEDVADLAPAALTFLSLFANEAEQLADRPLSFQETTDLCQKFLVPSVLAQFLEWTPWLDDEHSGTLELPPSSRLTNDFIGAINPNDQSLTMNQALEKAGAKEIEQKLLVMNQLTTVLPWLRFSPSDGGSA